MCLVACVIFFFLFLNFESKPDASFCFCTLLPVPHDLLCAELMCCASSILYPEFLLLCVLWIKLSRRVRRSDSCRSNGADQRHTQAEFSLNVKWDVVFVFFLADFWNPDIKENKCLRRFIILSDENKIKIKVKNHQISCFSRFWHFFFFSISLLWYDASSTRSSAWLEMCWC